MPRMQIHLTLVLLLMSPIVATPALRATPTPPNILVILADDQGWGDLGIHGHPSIRTPHLDQLARAGTQFSRFYVQPVCAPTRAEFLTGRYHLRGGVYDVSRGGERLALREETLADVLRRAGYATGCFGKWHNGSQYPYHPNGRGFDEFYGFTSGHWGNYFNAMMDHNGDVVTGAGYMTNDLTDHTIAFMREHHAQATPFFAYFAINTPHSPMQVPDKYWDAWDDRAVPTDHRFADREDREHTRAALAMVENIDTNVGRLLAALDEMAIADHTIVIYFSDNGPNGARWNGDLKGTKGHLDEGGIRSPLFLRWPNQVPAGTEIHAPAAAIDLLPTLADLTNIELASPHPLDGVSFAAALTAAAPPPRDRYLFAHWRGNVSVRGDRWMLDQHGELFDLAHDPQQYQTVTGEHPAIAADLRERVSRWRADMASTGATQNPAITLGHPDARFTPLPARDAQLHGALERSNQYPNDSYVRHWTSPEDRLTWNVDVPADGRFAVTLYYTCPPADLGSMVQLDGGDATISTRITEAWDPPELGAEHDRIPRQESYVKDFRPLRLGKIDLAAGEHTLALHAPEIPGSTALEFRLLQFERLPSRE
jgi:arylsulfatase A-like enzyme